MYSFFSASALHFAYLIRNLNYMLTALKLSDKLSSIIKNLDKQSS